MHQLAVAARIVGYWSTWAHAHSRIDDLTGDHPAGIPIGGRTPRRTTSIKKFSKRPLDLWEAAFGGLETSQLRVPTSAYAGGSTGWRPGSGSGD
jgi:hypothetical protein